MINFKKVGDKVYSVYSDEGQKIGQVRKTFIYGKTAMWANNQSRQKFSTRKEAAEDLVWFQDTPPLGKDWTQE